MTCALLADVRYVSGDSVLSVWTLTIEGETLLAPDASSDWTTPNYECGIHGHCAQDCPEFRR